MPRTTKRSSKNKPATEPNRFAHPFFTTQPAETRSAVPGVGKRLVEHIQGKLQAIPAPVRTPPRMALADIIGTKGSQEIEASGSLRFHAVGDTGRKADSPQGLVAQAMQKDFDVSNPAASPAFLFHLGDVLYGHDKDQGYRREFYEPYAHYAGKIIAIPGNHDGEVFEKTDPVSLKAFKANFCAPTQSVPAIAGTIFRETMNQPGVYWLLDAPFVQIVGLYSNAAENPGFISGTIPGQAQKNWLAQTLNGISADRRAGKRKALVFATHHPPFTAGGHSPSPEMLADIDGVCQQTKVMPDMFLSGHAHNYQHYLRELNFNGRTLKIPYLVAGTGGVGDQAVPDASGQKTGDHTFVKSRKGYGYLLVEATNNTIAATMFGVDPDSGARTQFDTVSVPLS